MVQTFFHRNTANWNNTFSGNPFVPSFTSVTGQVECVMPTGGVIKNLRMRADVALGATQTLTFTFFKGGVAQSLTVTLTNASGTSVVSDTSNTVSYSAGDLIRVVATRANNPNVLIYWQFDWEPTTDDAAIYAWGGASSNMDTDTDYAGFIATTDTNGYSASLSQRDLVAVGGTITAHTVSFELAPGVGKTRVFTVMLNGVAQDGSGGTQDSRLTIADAATSGSVTGLSIVVAAGDNVTVRMTQTGSATTTRGGGLVVMVSDTPDTWNIGGGSSTGLSGTSNLYHQGWKEGGSWSGTETQTHEILSGTFYFSGLRWKVHSGAPGAGKSWHFTFRKNSADTTQQATISDANLSAVTSGVVMSATSGDQFSTEAEPINTPGASGGVNWVLGISNIEPLIEIRGSVVFGESTTITAPRAAAFGLDGNTNVHDEEGKLKVFGDFEVTGETTLTGGVLSVLIGSQAPGSFTIATELFGLHGKRLTLTTTQRGTIEGTGRLVISG